MPGLRAGHDISVSLRRLCELAVKGKAELVGGHFDGFAVLDVPTQYPFGKRILHRLLNTTFERPRTVSGIPALFGQPIARLGIELEHDLAVVEQPLKSRDLNVDDLPHVRLLEAVEEDNLVYAVEKFRP